MTEKAWMPENFAKRRGNLRCRTNVIKATRAYFDGQGFAEVDTPALQYSPGNEVHLQAFKTKFKDYHGGPEQTLYLHTSPEFAMKKLLVAGEEKIYQIAHVFRNGERSSTHHPEFSMIEWYRAHEETPALIEDCTNLIRAVASSTGIEQFAANGMRCDPFLEPEILPIPEAFEKYANIDLMATAPDPYHPDPELLLRQMEPLNLHTAPDDTWEDLFFRILGATIEPFLGRERLTFLTDYPISMAALSRAKPDDPRLADRFELYIAGLELANAFGELTDAGEQLRRFEADMDKKQKLHGERFPIDMDFIDALRQGMPPSAGIALGMDRLVMLCAGTENIEDVLWLPMHSFD